MLRLTQVGNALREKLEERNLSMADLAELTGISYATVRRIARPWSNPPLDYALVICRALDAAVENIFWLEEEEKEVRKRSTRLAAG